MMEIRSTKDLAEAMLGRDSSFSELKRCVYKYTDCGAWVEEDSWMESGPRETWYVYVRKTIRGPMIVGTRKPHGKTGWYSAAARWVVEAAAGGPDNVDHEGYIIDPYMRDSVQDMIKSAGDYYHTRFTLEGVSRQVRVHGVKVGSIVEGVDDGTEVHYLKFPFTLAEFEEALSEVEEEARRIWDDTHGCPDCYDYPAGVLHPVDPECPKCGGQGVVI